MSDITASLQTLRTPWRAVAAAFALNGVLLGVWASRIPAITEIHGLSPSRLGLILLFMGAGALISFPLAGRLADSLGAARITRWVAVGYIFTLILIGVAPGPVWLAGAVFLFGMHHGSMDVVMNTWATEVEKHMGRSVMASFHAMWSFGAGAGAGIGYFATSAGLGVSSHFTLAALLFGALLLPFVLTPWQSETRPHDPNAAVFALPRGALVLVGIIALAAAVGEGAIADWGAVFLVQEAGAREAQATLGYTVFSIAMVAMRLSADRIITLAGPVAVARASGVIAAAGMLLALGFATLPMTLLGFALVGVGYAAAVPLAFSRAAIDPDIPPGQAIASVATLGYGGLLLGPPMIGFVAEATSLRVAFGLLAALALLITAFGSVLRREE
ncbi:putative MFS family arabinose efflux permease [Aliiruegeria haliotis]|uniref:Putative MFS family arabinose efflux permease n=2 Tax=Aliiruegeria haliotis TaxID=1280846 RepID=A0A2T0RMZ2_9RHOB|nr:MFS transporter [Aliiruegeria haliotis]PRY22511.1 putative MFS family arabinose efflux permease [Aliiruegeria haliotis]